MGMGDLEIYCRNNPSLLFNSTGPSSKEEEKERLILPGMILSEVERMNENRMSRENTK